MNTYQGDSILPLDLQDVPVMPLEDPELLQPHIDTYRANWNDNYSSYNGNNNFTPSEVMNYSSSQRGGARNFGLPYDETPLTSLAAVNGMSPCPASSSSFMSPANNSNYIDDLLLPEDDNSLRPAWPASANMPGAANSSFAMRREDAEPSTPSGSRGEHCGTLFPKWRDHAQPSNSHHLHTDDGMLGGFSHGPSWDTSPAFSDNLQASNCNDLYPHSEYHPNTEAVFGCGHHEHFQNNIDQNSCFSEGFSELSLSSEQVSENSGSDEGRQIRNSKQKPRQRLTKEEYSCMTPEQKEARRRENMKNCSREYRARKKQEEDSHKMDLETQLKKNQELTKKKISLERQRQIMRASLEQRIVI